MWERQPVTTLTGMTLLDQLATGRRWVVDAGRSRVELEMHVAGLVAVRGRFTRVRGHLDRPDESGEEGCAVHVDVEAASLTTGSACRDAVLNAAGIIDTAAGPLITYRSRTLRPAPHGGWQVLGVIGTARCALPLRLAVGDPETTPEGVMLHGRGELSRDDVVRLVARSGAAVLMGPTATLDLTLALRPVLPGE